MTAFDTLKYAEALEAGGIPQKQAKAQATALAEALKEGAATLATQQDILLVKQDIAALRQEMNARFAEAKFEILKWMLGAMAVQAGIIVGLLKLL